MLEPRERRSGGSTLLIPSIRRRAAPAYRRNAAPRFSATSTSPAASTVSAARNRAPPSLTPSSTTTAPMSYLRRWRMVLARQDIERGDRIQLVATRYGYASTEALGCAFKRLHAQKPTAFRSGPVLSEIPVAPVAKVKT